MIWKQKTKRPLEMIVHTAFLVSLTSYVVFWLSDIMVPGFVSRYFSVHVFLFASTVFGVLWSITVEEYAEHTWFHILLSVTFGVVLAVLTWGLIEDLGVYRLFISLIVGSSPLIVYTLIRK